MNFCKFKFKGKQNSKFYVDKQVDMLEQSLEAEGYFLDSIKDQLKKIQINIETDPNSYFILPSTMN